MTYTCIDEFKCIFPYPLVLGILCLHRRMRRFSKRSAQWLLLCDCCAPLPFHKQLPHEQRMNTCCRYISYGSSYLSNPHLRATSETSTIVASMLKRRDRSALQRGFLHWIISGCIQPLAASQMLHRVQCRIPRANLGSTRRPCSAFAMASGFYERTAQCSRA